MTKTVPIEAGFTAEIWVEDDWHIAWAIEPDVVSQGRSEKEALYNLREALDLYYDEPHEGGTAEQRKAWRDARRMNLSIVDIPASGGSDG